MWASRQAGERVGGPGDGAGRQEARLVGEARLDDQAPPRSTPLELLLVLGVVAKLPILIANLPIPASGLPGPHLAFRTGPFPPSPLRERSELN